MQDLERIIESLGAFLGLGSMVGAAIFWYRDKVRKDYARQRDWEHLKRHYDQLAQEFERLIAEQDRRFDLVDLELREIKGLTTNCLINQGDAHRLGENYGESL